MADPLGTLMQVVEVVGKVIEIYKKIQDAPDQIRRIGRRMSRLNTILRNLESLLRTDKKNSLARLGPALTDELLGVIKDIRKESEDVQVLFVKWDKDIGPWGMQFRFKFAAQAYFALGSSSDKLEALSNSIDEHREDLRDLLAVMMGSGINQLLVVGQSPGIVRQPSPSPSPQPPRTDFRIIFVDPYNVARSIVAEAYASLLREWTVRTGGQWRIKTVHSAGFFVRTRSEVVDTINTMQMLYPSYKLSFKDGHSLPAPPPLSALFENQMFNYPYKQDVKKAMESRRSRGLTKAIFQTYDYILVFTDREEDNLIRLRKLLVDSNGKDLTAAKRKGKVMHLGRYLTTDGARKEILAAKNDGDRDQWNAKVGQIKIAIKAFLKRELDWRQPPKGAAQS
ncbi:hypothetical protein KVR01_007307 [Diaporthe batatas]|uniref:uncharacterized protein n=1 Tax=Diaporthe batatas TaxID=748121 RepID=UPI001D0590B5|nr:uncharacterized protein KVR01_007307 [Diaporthe batatas]KAG8162829.1 hypothetical protein KVR01_007307 [Diaporthe batatas]